MANDPVETLHELLSKLPQTAREILRLILPMKDKGNAVIAALKTKYPKDQARLDDFEAEVDRLLKVQSLEDALDLNSMARDEAEALLDKSQKDTFADLAAALEKSRS